MPTPTRRQPDASADGDSDRSGRSGGDGLGGGLVYVAIGLAAVVITVLAFVAKWVLLVGAWAIIAIVATAAVSALGVALLGDTGPGATISALLSVATFGAVLVTGPILILRFRHPSRRTPRG